MRAATAPLFQQEEHTQPIVLDTTVELVRRAIAARDALWSSMRNAQRRVPRRKTKGAAATK